MNRHITLILIAILASISFSSCKVRSVVVPPVESSKIEYQDKLVRDSIYLLDSVFVDRWRSNDTVFLTKEKFRYLYKDVLVRDSIYITDSIQVPYPVIETLEVKAPYTWYEKTLMILGAIGFGMIGYKIYSIIRK